jgi:hypothetical protein
MGRRSGVNLRDGLIAAYCPAIGGSAGFLLPDVSGNQNSIVTNIATTTSQGVVDGSYEGIKFNGSDEGGVSREVPFFPVFTMLAWMRFSSVNVNTSFRTVFAKHTTDGSASDFYLYRHSTNVLRVDHPWILANVANSGSYAIANDEVGLIALQRYGSAGAWVYDIWHNGEYRSSNSTASNPNQGSHFIRLAKLSTASGSLSFAASNTYFDVRFYSRLLSSSELRSIYEMGPGCGLRNERRRSYYVAAATSNRYSLFEPQVIGAA